MTSLRVAGTGPLTPSGSFRVHHSPAGMQKGGAGGREGLGSRGPSPGRAGGACRKWEQGAIPQCLQAPHCGSFSFPHPPLFFMSFFVTPFTRQGHAKIQSFIHSLNISVCYKWGDRNAFHLFIQHTLKIISLCKTARCNQLLSYVTGERCISSGYS